MRRLVRAVDWGKVWDDASLGLFVLACGFTAYAVWRWL